MKEIRVAAVMNGGISLAVWMGGVTHELNRVRLAGGPHPPTDERERAVHDAWRAILDAADARVVVDTVAGTSAGGLNGTLLATAVARGADLTGLKETWVDQASLEAGKLLRADPEGAATLLDGDFFTDRINEVVAGIGAPGTGTFEPQECTLLVTATAVGPSLARMTLERNRLDFYRDSRRVFRFRRELGADGAVVDDDFVPTGSTPAPGVPSGPLARAARASASYPAAFAPVQEDDDLRRHRNPGSPPVAQFPLMDGGVLDNAPFEPIIDALRERPIGAPFERVLLYVVPSARARAADDLGSAEVPDVGDVVRTLLGTVREPDQRLDVDLLDRSFEQMAFRRSKPHALLAGFLTDATASSAAWEGAATALFDAYRIGRAEAFERQLTCFDDETMDLRQPAPASTDPDAIPVVPPRSAAARGALDPGTPWQWGDTSADRILRWLGRAMVQAAQLRGERAEHAAEVFATIQRSQREVRAVARSLNERLARAIEADDPFSVRLSHFTRACAAVGVGDPLGRAVAAAATAVATWRGGGTRGADVVAVSLQLEVLSSVFSWGGDANDAPAFRYLQASPAARCLVEIPTVTRRPGDAGYEEQNAAWAARKLYGERWGHFGAFALERGREHDWLWGRLDGASTLVEMLLGSAGADSPLVADLVDAILAAEGTDLDALTAGASEVAGLGTRNLYDAVVAEAGGEERRELLLRTLPEVLGEIEVLPGGAAEIGHALRLTAEGYLDVLEALDAVDAGVRDLVRRLWRRLFGSDD